MSVQLFYGAENLKRCLEEEHMCGLCFVQLHQKGESYGEKFLQDTRNILIDLGKYHPLEELTWANCIDEISLNFGSVPVGSKTVRDIIVHNSTNNKAPIPTEFYAEPREELKEQYDKVFHILLQEHSDIFPLLAITSNHTASSSCGGHHHHNNKSSKLNRSRDDNQFKFRILFKPKLPGISYTTILKIWLGKYPIKLRCHGFSEGPLVCFSQNIINFGGQYYGMETQIKVTMLNRSIADATFQFDVDNARSVFKICPQSGILPAQGKMTIEIYFRPHKPQTFYKRAYCLIHMQSPQYLDLLGVCIPRPFFIDKSIDFCVSVANTHFLPVPKPSFGEYFSNGAWGVEVSQENFNFGRKTLKPGQTNCSSGDSTSPGEREPEIRTFTLTLTSTLPYDVLVEWVPDPLQVFIISPMTTFLNARASATFEILFNPGFPDTFFGGQLECYIYPTTYVWPKRIAPWIYTHNCGIYAPPPPRTTPTPTGSALILPSTNASATLLSSIPNKSPGVSLKPSTSAIADESQRQGQGKESITSTGAGTGAVQRASTTGEPGGREKSLSSSASATVVISQTETLTVDYAVPEKPIVTPAPKKSSVTSALSYYDPVYGQIPFEIKIKNSDSCVKHRIIALKNLIKTDPENPELLEDYIIECSPPGTAENLALEVLVEDASNINDDHPEDDGGQTESEALADAAAAESAPAEPDATTEVLTPVLRTSKSKISLAGSNKSQNKKKTTKKPEPAGAGAATRREKTKSSSKKNLRKNSKLGNKGDGDADDVQGGPGTEKEEIPINSEAEGEDGDGVAPEELVSAPPPSPQPTPTATASPSNPLIYRKSNKSSQGLPQASVCVTVTASTNDDDEFGGGDYCGNVWGPDDSDGVNPLDPSFLQKRDGPFSVPCSRGGEGGGDGGTLEVSGPTELAVPLCLTVRLTGHTYGASSHPPVPHFSLPSRVTMSPTLPQHRESRTIVMKNNNDIPIQFDVQDLDTSNVYTTKPAIGVIPGDGQQIFMISMNTSEPQSKAYNHDFQFNINVVDKNEVSVAGYAEVPELVITLLSDPTGSVNEIVCPTTIPGFCTWSYFTMKNPSRFHYRYFIEFADDDIKNQPIFTVSPSNGILAPYEYVKVSLKFVPYEYVTYRIPWRFRFEVMGGKAEGSSWNAMYECLLVLQGTGSECSLTANPKSLDFDVVQIYESVSKCFTVINDGTAIIVAKLVPRHEQWLEWYGERELIIHPTMISLKPGETIDIETTIRAEKVVMYNFYIDYELEAAETDGNGCAIVDVVKPVRLIEISFMGSHSIVMVTDILQIARHQSWDSEQCWAMFSIDELNRLLKPLKCAAKEGLLPDVPTVPFRFPNAPVGSPPIIFTLLLTSMGESILCWQIHTLPPKNSKFHQMHNKGTRQSFSGNATGDDSDSFLTALWTTKYAETFPNMKHKSLSLTAAKNGDHFIVTPTRGFNHETKQKIHFKFYYEKEGSHKMPILLRIYPAIFVWLELQCDVLKPRQANLQPMYNKEMIFHPISLSDLDPPIQSFWLYNGSAEPSTFIVDMNPFKRVKGRNFGHSCIECLTPEGAVLPKSWGAVKLRFSPLEYRTYRTHLRMRLNNAEDWTQVELKGNAAMSENVDLRPRAPSHPSDICSAFIPITLRPQRIIFPHYVPTGDRASSVVFITNLSSTHNMSFAWPEATYVNSTCIKFLPDYGTLAPKEQFACQVLVQAGDVNQILLTNVRCWIEDETAVHQFQRQNKLWSGEIVEYEMATVVTKKEGPHVVRRKSMYRQPVKPESFSQLLTISCYIGSVFGTMDNIWSPELSKMPFTDPIGIQPLPGEGRRYGKKSDRNHILTLTPINRHLAEEVITQIFWDMTILSPNWPSYVREITKRQVVYFEDYKMSEQSTEIQDEMQPLYSLPRKTKEDVMEFAFFNMLQEMADRFASGEHHWAVLAPSDLR